MEDLGGGIEKGKRDRGLPNKKEIDNTAKSRNPFDKGSLAGKPEQKIEPENIREGKWQVTEEGKSYVINTGGCGAIKVFVQTENEKYSIIYHSDGKAESLEAAKKLGDFILRKGGQKLSVEILNIQPYEVSSDVSKCVKALTNTLRAKRDLSDNSPIDIKEKVMILNKISGVRRPIEVHLDGSIKEISDRYNKLVLKDREMPAEDKQKKIMLFATKVPPNLKLDPEFRREWADLSLEQAQKKVNNINPKKGFRKFFPKFK